MKKLFLLLAIVGMTAIQSCDGPEGPQGPPGPAGSSVEAEVFEIRNVNFIGDSNGFYGISYDLNPAILNSDMILVYRLKAVAGNLDVWESLPKTYYLPNGELDYNFDFTAEDIEIYLGFTSPEVLTAQYTSNQIFRVVIIPGYLSNKVSAIDTNNFDHIKTALKLTEEDFTGSQRN
ncbi:MAG TPA: hypothetical protein VFQ50_11995 [Flavobacterium sp.]|nr:hypothetical protein [Flavobacterium sp.]